MTPGENAMTETLDPKVLKTLLFAQRNEVTESRIYARLARTEKNPENKKVLEQIAREEQVHADIWKKYTGRDVKPSKVKIAFYTFLARFLGLTFGLKLMEKGEELAQGFYEKVSVAVPEAKKIAADEKEHEAKLLSLLNEERLEYMGSIVLGLNDALVELTGALAGFTFAIQNPKITAAAGLITGIAASFSMAASEYLSGKADGATTGKALKSAVYTGIAYILTVIVLILPFLLMTSSLPALAITLGAAILIILFFNFYISVAKDLPFLRRFLEMAFISLGVAALSFGIGVIVRNVFGIDI